MLLLIRIYLTRNILQRQIETIWAILIYIISSIVNQIHAV